MTMQVMASRVEQVYARLEEMREAFYQIDKRLLAVEGQLARLKADAAAAAGDGGRPATAAKRRKAV